MRVLKGDELLFLLLWCLDYIGAKLGVPVAGTFTLLLYRFLVMMLVVAVIISVRREWRAPDRDTLLVGFFAHFVWLVAIFTAFEFGLNAGSVALIAAFQPALTALVSPLPLGKANDALRWCGIVVGFAVAWGGQLVFAIIWLAIPVSIGANGLMLYLIRTRDATRISALQYFVPPVAIMIA